MCMACVYIPQPSKLRLPFGTRYNSITYWYRMSDIVPQTDCVKYDVLPLICNDGFLIVNVDEEIDGVLGD